MKRNTLLLATALISAALVGPVFAQGAAGGAGGNAPTGVPTPGTAAPQATTAPTGTGTTGVAPTGTATTGTGYPGNTMLVPASGLVVYEVLFSNPSAIEAATVSVSVNPTGGTPQTNVTAGAVVGFAPFYASGGAADPAQLMTP